MSVHDGDDAHVSFRLDEDDGMRESSKELSSNAALGIDPQRRAAFGAWCG